MAKEVLSNKNELDDCRKIPFSVLPKSRLSAPLMKQLLDAMKMSRQENGGVEAALNETIPAGFTYLGQFIVHDLIVIGEKEIPTLGLEPLYGGGPRVNPKFYSRSTSELPASMKEVAEPETTFKRFEDVLMRLEQRRKNTYDVPREEESMDLKGKAAAEMGSAFNDLNFLVLQIHTAFAHFHNAIAAWICESEPNLSNDALLKKTQETVIWHYQWLVVHQFLPMLVGEDLVKKLLQGKKNQFRLFNVDEPARLMPEFSKGAMRFGHSQVREFYVFPRANPTPFNNSVRARIFADSATNDRYLGKHDEFRKKDEEYLKKPIFQRIVSPPPEKPERPQDLGDLRGGIKRDNLEMDWTFFFDYGAFSDNEPQSSLAIDHKIAEPLFDLFFFAEKQKEPSLPKRDILQSTKSLPSGYALHLAYLAKNPNGDPAELLTSEKVSERMEIEGLRVEDLPLWLYILLEAEINRDGKCLGELGSRIVAEQIIWVLLCDKTTFLHQKRNEDSYWTPEERFRKWRGDKTLDIKGMTKEAEQFCILDLLEFPKSLVNK